MSVEDKVGQMGIDWKEAVSGGGGVHVLNRRGISENGSEATHQIRGGKGTVGGRAG